MYTDTLRHRESSHGVDDNESLHIHREREPTIGYRGGCRRVRGEKAVSRQRRA